MIRDAAPGPEIVMSFAIMMGPFESFICARFGRRNVIVASRCATETASRRLPAPLSRVEVTTIPFAFEGATTVSGDAFDPYAGTNCAICCLPPQAATTHTSKTPTIVRTAARIIYRPAREVTAVR